MIYQESTTMTWLMDYIEFYFSALFTWFNQLYILGPNTLEIKAMSLFYLIILLPWALIQIEWIQDRWTFFHSSIYYTIGMAVLYALVERSFYENVSTGTMKTIIVVIMGLAAALPVYGFIFVFFVMPVVIVRRLVEWHRGDHLLLPQPGHVPFALPPMNFPGGHASPAA